MYYLHYTSSNSSGLSCVPLDKGRWAWQNGKYVMDESFNELQPCDGLYDILDVDGDNEDNPHYSAVMDTLIPIWKREQTAMSFTVDGIDYAFEVKTFEAQAV